MSIPPLVCSTPPPPDQCEDDKDPEDFDLSYSLSQEDDDDDDNNGYDYGNFTSYNHFQSAPDNKPLEIKEQQITPHRDSKDPKDIYFKYENSPEQNNTSPNLFETDYLNEHKVKCEEDINIEDLDLKVDDDIANIVESTIDQSETSELNVVTIKDFDIPCHSNNESLSCDDTNVSSLEDNAVDSIDVITEPNSDVLKPVEIQSVELTKDEPSADVPDISVATNHSASLPIEENKQLKLEEIGLEKVENKDTVAPALNQNSQDMDDDDFGEFDEFQSVNTNNDLNVVNSVVNSDNPWENADPEDSDFGSFTANFEENKFNITEDVKPVVESIPVLNTVNEVDNEIKNTDNDIDDDFGEFDDFKSSTKTKPQEFSVEEHEHIQELPVLNLQSTESDYQIMESIAKVLSSVFSEEIPEPETEFEGKLETLLSETWGHLMETDERQPYIVNWNNSLGQKTLLRALCIDSRNILFGPKWSCNMPKYAANLSNAPLQPQKQQATVPSCTVTPNEVAGEKSSSKATTWTDPFTSDGQESCNTDNEPASIAAGPANVNVFEAPISTKPDKIFSNTMGVQPLRQINLPDTHIFTPTDSEIPRSKTIHYEPGPTVLLPQTVMATSKNQVEASSATNVTENNLEDNEYWDFQNFKGVSDIHPSALANNSQQTPTQEKNFETATIVNALPKQNIAYQTELLQPIKVEPAMPALNWPDPGEVKGVFDDFSDFVSIPSQTTEKQESPSIQPTESPLEFGKMNANFKILNEEAETVAEITQPNEDSFDDDFDTFQSAPPSKSAPDDTFNSSHLGNTMSQMQTREFEYRPPNIDNSNKSDNISFASIPRQNEALTSHLSFVPNTTEFTSNIPLPSGTQPNILQPMPANFSTANILNQQKSGQILQPLSLESYSQINWPSPGIDLQDLSRFNPVETLHSLKSDLSVSGLNKGTSPSHASAKNTTMAQAPDDDVWGEFVSSKPKQQQQQVQPKKPSAFVDDDEWTDFISSSSAKPQNGLNTISLNVHTNSHIQKSAQSKFNKKSNQPPLDIPTLNYITPKSNAHKAYNDKHFQNL